MHSSRQPCRRIVQRSGDTWIGLQLWSLHCLETFCGEGLGAWNELIFRSLKKISNAKVT